MSSCPVVTDAIYGVRPVLLFPATYFPQTQVTEINLLECGLEGNKNTVKAPTLSVIVQRHLILLYETNHVLLSFLQRYPCFHTYVLLYLSQFSSVPCIQFFFFYDTAARPTAGGCCGVTISLLAISYSASRTSFDVT